MRILRLRTQAKKGRQAAPLGELRLVQLDVSAEASVIHAVVEKAWTSFGFIDIHLNNAGFRGAPFVAKPLSFLVVFPDPSLFLPLMFLIRKGKKKQTS